VGARFRVRSLVLWSALLTGATLATASCSNTKGEESHTAPRPVLVGAENVIVVKRDQIVAGPIISGDLRPEREAVLRAQLGGSMLEVRVKEGQSVREGAVLGRIEARTLEDTSRSAQSAVHSAETQLQVAQREADRTQQLVTAGALAAREVDLARNTVTSSEAQLADARSRLVTAQKQLDDAVVRSPINGVISRRTVNAGDIVTAGAELFTVVDPSSMRLEASVPSESLPELRIGAKVAFSVRGYEQPFEGRIDRIAPQTDAATRQLPIYVSIPNTAGRLVGGLFAEGRVVTDSATGIVVPSNAINTSGAMPWAARVVNSKVERVNVTLGLRDPRTERVQIVSGLNAGDTLLRGAAQGIAPGTQVQVSVPSEDAE
jgi:membrane fusion protein (multidrug efflux system)